MTLLSPRERRITVAVLLASVAGGVSAGDSTHWPIVLGNVIGHMALAAAGILALLELAARHLAGTR